MQVATVGAVGIPWIGDLNGDSYPEIFVPQGNKLHIYAYGTFYLIIKIIVREES